MEPSATVQIVTFYMGEGDCQQTRWERVLKRPAEVKEVLGRKQEPNTWRWIHCEGLHGPTIKAVAEGTSACLLSELHRFRITRCLDWPLDRFAGIFSCWYSPEGVTDETYKLQKGPGPVLNGLEDVCSCTFWTN
jgi:hypothetical protein